MAETGLRRDAPATFDAPAPQLNLGPAFGMLVLAGLGVLAGWASFHFEWKVVLGIVLGLYVTAQTAVKPIAGLVFMIIALPFVDLFPPTLLGIPGLNALNLILLVVGVFGLGNALLRRQPMLPRNPVTGALLGYCVLMLLAFLVTLQNPPSWMDVVVNDLKASMTSFAPFFLAATIVRTEKQRKIVLYTVMVMVIFVAARSLVDYGIDLAQGAPPERIRIGGLIGQANDFGGYMAINIPVILLMALGERRAFWRPFLIAGGAASVMAMLFSQSRGGILACGLAITALGMLRERKLLLAFILAIALSPLWVPSVVMNRFEETRQVDETTGEEQFDRSSQVRLDIWQGGVDLFESSPIFGHGWATFTAALGQSQFEGQVRSPHSTYVRTLAETGLVGALGLLWLLGTLLGFGMRRPPYLTPFDQQLTNGLFGAALAVIVVNIFGTRFYNIEEMGYFWVLTGLVATCAWNARGSGAPQLSHPAGAHAATGTLV